MKNKYIYIIGAIIGFIFFLNSYNVFAITTPLAHASSTAFATALSLTYSITGSYTTDTNATLIVFYEDNNGGDTDYSVTYAGANMTGGGGGVVYGNHFWAYLHATSTSSFNGIKNIVVSETIAVRNIHSTAIIVTGTDITGIPTSASSTAALASTIFQNNLTTNLDELVIDNLWFAEAGRPLATMGTGQSWLATYISGAEVNGDMDSTKKTATSTGVVSMYETISGATAGSSVALSVKGAAAVAALPASIESDFLIFE